MMFFSFFIEKKERRWKKISKNNQRQPK